MCSKNCLYRARDHNWVESQKHIWLPMYLFCVCEYELNEFNWSKSHKHETVISQYFAKRSTVKCSCISRATTPLSYPVKVHRAWHVHRVVQTTAAVLVLNDARSDWGRRRRTRRLASASRDRTTLRTRQVWWNGTPPSRTMLHREDMYNGQKQANHKLRLKKWGRFW